MKQINRAMHFDFHTEPGIENILKNFDAEEFAEKLKRNHVEYINITARCNVGFSYYDTRVGVKYEGLNRDILKEVILACHKRNIGVTAYINGGLNHEMMARNQSWCKVNKDGSRYLDDKTDHFFRMCCYNSGYREHLLNEIKEICSYDIDGLFVDCMLTRECYCPECLKKMKEKNINIDNENEVYNYQYDLKVEVANEIKELAIKTTGKKDLMIYFNGLPFDNEVQSHAEVECLTSCKLWGYDYFYVAAPYVRSKFDQLIFMSGRFQSDWGDFGGIKSLTSMQDDMHTAIMNGFGISFGDHLHPIDGIEDEVLSRVNKVFEEEMQYEKYVTSSRPIVDVGVLTDTNMFEVKPTLQGICKLLQDLHISYNIYDENSNIDQIKLLILPKSFELTAKLKKLLSTFASSGGKFIFLGDGIKTGRELGLLNYIESINFDTSDNAYFTFGKNNMRFAMYRPKLLVKNKDGKELSKYVYNIFNSHFDGRHSYNYKPQGKISTYSAALINSNTGCICFDVSEAYFDSFLPEIRLLTKEVIDNLLPERTIEAEDLPIYAQISLTKNDKYTVLHIKADYPEIKNGRGILEDHVYLKNQEISVKGEYSIKELPSLKDIDYTNKDNRTVFNTGDFLGYKAFLLTEKK